jgi:hypothetical protein
VRQCIVWGANAVASAVTRVVCKGVSYELELTLDINSEVYRLRQNDKFTFTIVSTLDLEGKPDDGTFNQSGKVRLVFKIELLGGERRAHCDLVDE